MVDCDEWYLYKQNIELCNSVTIDWAFVESALGPNDGRCTL